MREGAGAWACASATRTRLRRRRSPWPATSARSARPGELISLSVSSSVADPDPCVFGPPGSGSIRQRYGSGFGSGSFYHQAKIVRKTLIPTVV